MMSIRTVSLLVVASMSVAAQAVTVVSSQATYVQSGTFANQNFGSDPNLLVKNYGQAGDWTRKSFIAFDLSSMNSTILTSALKLRTAGTLGTYSGGTHTFNVYGGAGSSWSENGITFNDAPGNPGSALGTLDAPLALMGTFTVSSSEVTDSEITFASASLLGLINSNLGGSITLGITRVTAESLGNTIVHRFVSDDGINGPGLELEPVPEPASIAALAVGLLALRRRRSQK